MGRFTPIMTSLVLAAAFTALPAMADDTYNGPKPLTAAPAPDFGVKKQDPNAMPQDLVDERTKSREAFNGMIKEEMDLKAKCNDVHTQVDRADCGRKMDYWQTRMDALTAKAVTLYEKIRAWRRKNAGLPPAPVAPAAPPPVYNRPSTTPNTAPATTNNSQNSVLLPSGSTTVPANTY